MLPSLFQAQAVQGWSSGMLQIVDALLADQIAADGCLLEIGCGGGQFLHHWRQSHPHQRLFGVDLHAAALPFAQKLTQHSVQLSQADLCTLPFAPDSFDAIVALDVLDQEGVALSAALAEAKRLLKPCGRFLLRVSAYPWLYGAHDIAFNTGQRFAKVKLRQALEAAGFGIQRITYANALLAAPIILSRLLLQSRWHNSIPDLYDSTLSNQLFANALRLEARWLQRADLAFGISLYVLVAHLN